MLRSDYVKRTTPANWKILTNDGSTLTATNVVTGEAYSGTVDGFNLILTTVPTIEEDTGMVGVLVDEQGGTGQSTWTTGDLLYASATNVAAKLPIGNANDLLKVVDGVPAWAAPGSTFVPVIGGTMTGALKIADGTKSAPSLSYNSEATVGLYYRTPGYLSFAVNNKAVAEVTESSLNISTIGFAAAESNDFSTVWISTYFGTEGAGFLRMRGVVGTNPQAFRIYGTYTDASNYQRLALSANGTTGVTIAAETLGTGGDNLDIVLTPAGTGSVKFPSGASVDSSGVVTGAAFVTASAGYFGGVVIGYPSSDAAFLRGSAGQIDVTNGTANTYRDLKLRNLLSTGYATIDSGTLTASAPALDVTQTWNNAAVAFTGLKLNVTNTASDAASLLQDWRVGGTSVMAIDVAGRFGVTTKFFQPNTSTWCISHAGLAYVPGVTFRANGVQNNSAGFLSWASTTNSEGTQDVYLYRDAAATLAQRNSTTQQISRIYNTYTDSSNYERLTLTGVAGTSVNITAETLGTGGDNLDIVLTPAGTGTVKTSVFAAQVLYAGIPGVTVPVVLSYNGNIGLSMGDTSRVSWSSNSEGQTAADTGFARNAAGIVEVNNGTAGTYRDLKLRNLLSTGYATIDSGTLTASAPAVNVTQTWNQGATQFESIAVDVTNTASGSSASYFVGKTAGSINLRLRRDGYFVGTGLITANVNTEFYGPGIRIASGAAYSWCQFGTDSTVWVSLYGEAAGTLAQRKGTTQQTFRLYNTYTDSSNYERLALTGVQGSGVYISAESAGTGSANLDLVLTAKGTGTVYVGATHFRVAGNKDVQAAQYTAVPFVSDLTLYAGVAKDIIFKTNTTELARLTSSGAMEFPEVTAPAAPAANSVRIYAEDNGSGRTQLMVKFATGVAQALRIETPASAVSALTAAATAGAGARAFVTDADSTTFGAAAVGGGANAMPVWCNGTGWFIG